MKTLMTWNPVSDLRSMDEVFDRLFGTTPSRPGASILPIDLIEQDGSLVVKAAVPGISPEELDVQVENNVLTIKGEHRQENHGQDAKVYRREVAYGQFARSIRLPENLDLENIDAEFKHGMVTVRIPKLEEPKKTVKINVRSSEPAISQNAEAAPSNN